MPIAAVIPKAYLTVKAYNPSASRKILVKNLLRTGLLKNNSRSGGGNVLRRLALAMA